MTVERKTSILGKKDIGSKVLKTKETDLLMSLGVIGPIRMLEVLSEDQIALHTIEPYKKGKETKIFEREEINSAGISNGFLIRDQYFWRES